MVAPSAREQRVPRHRDLPFRRALLSCGGDGAALCAMLGDEALVPEALALGVRDLDPTPGEACASTPPPAITRSCAQLMDKRLARSRSLVSIVARILTGPGQRSTRVRKTDRAAALKEVTGNGKRFTSDQRFADLWSKEQQKSESQRSTDEWVLLAEHLGQRDAQPDAKVQLGAIPSRPGPAHDASTP
jgi:hypothetical protein